MDTSFIDTGHAAHLVVKRTGYTTGKKVTKTVPDVDAYNRALAIWQEKVDDVDPKPQTAAFVNLMAARPDGADFLKRETTDEVRTQVQVLCRPGLVFRKTNPPTVQVSTNPAGFEPAREPEWPTCGVCIAKVQNLLYREQQARELLPLQIYEGRGGTITTMANPVDINAPSSTQLKQVAKFEHKVTSDGTTWWGRLRDRWRRGRG